MKTNQKVYIRGNRLRSCDVIRKLVIQGATSNPFKYFGDESTSYYYINKHGEIMMCYDEELLKDAGYEEIRLPAKDSVIPFTSIDDMENTCHEHGYDVRNKNGTSLFNINRIVSLIRANHTDEETFMHLARYYEFADGTPCGNMVNNN